MSGPTDLRSCPRCGRRRFVKNAGRSVLCGDCKSVEPGWPDVLIPACTGHAPGTYEGSCPGCHPARSRPLTIHQEVRADAS